MTAPAALGVPPDALPAGRVTYDLRRLRLHGLIERQPKWARTLRPGLATVMPDRAPNDGRLRCAFERLEHAMDDWCAEAKRAA